MTTVNNFSLSATYDFTTHAPAILGTFKNVKVESIVNYKLAQGFIDPASLHANIYGSLPAGETVDDYRRYHYLIILLESGDRTAIPVPAVVEGSIQLKSRGKAFLTLEDVGPEDLSKIKLALTSNGFNVGEVVLE
jgi:hypothetical protein